MDRIKIRDVTIREGSQNPVELKGKSPAEKISLFNQIIKVGYDSVEFTAFAPGEWFSDCDQLAEEVCRIENPRQVGFEALYFNLKGLQRLQSYPKLVQQGVFHTALTEEYRVKNYNQRDVNDVYAKYEKHLEEFNRLQIPFSNLVLSTFFGDPKHKMNFNQILNFLLPLFNISLKHKLVPQQVTLADTEGVAGSLQVEVFSKQLLSEFPGLALNLHLHPQKKEAVSLCEAGLKAGVRSFDASIAGVGGSPFSANKRGNLDVRDLIKACIRTQVPYRLSEKALADAENYLFTLIR